MITIIIGCFFIGVGLLFFFGTALGLLRFPDFYTRLHAAGKGDTLSTVLILLGAILIYLEEHHWEGAALLVAVKVGFIVGFLFVGSPTATHAIISAGMKLGIKPWEKESDQ